jgi:hypothetical protein
MTSGGNVVARNQVADTLCVALGEKPDATVTGGNADYADKTL